MILSYTLLFKGKWDKFINFHKYVGWTFLQGKWNNQIAIMNFSKHVTIVVFLRVRDNHHDDIYLEKARILHENFQLSALFGVRNILSIPNTIQQ